MLVHAQPDPAALAQLYQQALTAKEKQFGAEHPKVARSASDLGLFLRNEGKKEEAEPYLRRAMAIDEKATGLDSAIATQDVEDLISVLPARDASPLIERLARSSLPEVAARNLAKLAAMQEARGNKQGALTLYRESLSKEESVKPANAARVGIRLNDVALLLEPQTAEPLLRRALALQDKPGAAKNPDTASTLNNLANVLLATGRVTQAEPLLRRGLSILEDTLGPRHPRVATASSNLADILRARKDYAGARRLYERAIAIDEAAYGVKHPEVAVDLDNLAELLEEMGLTAQARPLRERAAAVKTGAH